MSITKKIPQRNIVWFLYGCLLDSHASIEEVTIAITQISNLITEEKFDSPFNLNFGIYRLTIEGITQLYKTKETLEHYKTILKGDY